jgi:4-alpha-glucanotransferase
MAEGATRFRLWVPGFRSEMADAAHHDDLRQSPLNDYTGVASAKLSVLRTVWRQGATLPDAYVDADGDRPWRHALFEALSAEMVACGHGAGWMDWPRDWQDTEGCVIPKPVVCVCAMR